MPRYLVLNFSGNTGKTNGIKRMLTKGDTIEADIESYDLTELAHTYLKEKQENAQQALRRFVAHINQLHGDENSRFSLTEYDEIIIAAHGIINDCNYCYTVLQDWDSMEFSEEMKQLFTPVELAQFLNGCGIITAEHEEPHVNFNFLICYGARTQSYTANHVSDVNTADVFINQSFVGKFLGQFLSIQSNVSSAQILAKAYIGSVQARSDGDVFCDTEEKTAYFRELQQVDLQHRENLADTEIEEKLDDMKIAYADMEPQAGYGLVTFHSQHGSNISVDLSQRSFSLRTTLTSDDGCNRLGLGKKQSEC